VLLYRSGAWLGRAYCPEVLMGMQTAEELADIGTLQSGPGGEYTPAPLPPRPTRQKPTPVIENKNAEAEAEAGNREDGSAGSRGSRRHGQHRRAGPRR